MATQARKTFQQTRRRFFNEGIAILLLVVSIASGLAIYSFDASDPGWTSTGMQQTQINNWAGWAGAWFASLMVAVMGWVSWLMPPSLLWLSWRLMLDRKREDLWFWPLLSLRALGFLCWVVGLSVLLALNAPSALEFSAGGYLGWALGSLGFALFEFYVTSLLALALVLIGLTLSTQLSWLKLLDYLGHWALHVIRSLIQSRQLKAEQKKRTREAMVHRRANLDAQIDAPKSDTSKLQKAAALAATTLGVEGKKVRIEPLKSETTQPSQRAVRDKQQPLFKDAPTSPLPSLSLLNAPPAKSTASFSEQELGELSSLLEARLKDFGVSAEVVAVCPGPVITRFEIQPAAGVKVSKISALAKDLARSMAMISVRVVEIIPGKSVVGIEVPNNHRSLVSLQEVLASKQYDDASSPLTLALGHDISGTPVVVNLAKMPHLLVAGTTGSGKSVGVNAMLLSLLLKATPEQVRMILIDPKMLELSVYDGIPHLLTPVITDMKDAANGLRWCVAEMERRYRLMSQLGVRNLSGYNHKVREAIAAGEPIADPLWKPELSLSDTAPTLTPLPYVVVVIDEFADMMMIVGKKVEELIARIAQKARAAGIHMILATQRPSVDVITGLIKANIPTRIAFQVSSKIDSRTILDQGGAEQLLGHGDMLYMPPGSSHPMRIHGAFVADDEVHRVVAEWKQRGLPNYEPSITAGDQDNTGMLTGLVDQEGSDQGESDPLFDEAVAVVTESGRASISSVQRRLRIGYNRAARLIESMEAAGIVSPPAHNGTREVIAPPPPDH